MNLRTITFWAIYDPQTKMLIAERRTKKEIIERCHIPAGCVVVKMKGYYVQKRKTPSTRSAKG